MVVACLVFLSCSLRSHHKKTAHKKMAANARASILYKKNLQNAPPNICHHYLILPLHYAPVRSLGLDRKGLDKSTAFQSSCSGSTGHTNTVIGQVCGKAATASNGGIGKIAALPSFDKICYFCRELLVGKCVRAATSPIPWALGVSSGQQCKQ